MRVCVDTTKQIARVNVHVQCHQISNISYILHTFIV